MNNGVDAGGTQSRGNVAVTYPLGMSVLILIKIIYNYCTQWVVADRNRPVLALLLHEILVTTSFCHLRYIS